MPTIRPITFADYYKKVLTPKNIKNKELNSSNNKGKILIKNNGITNQNLNNMHVSNKK